MCLPDPCARPAPSRPPLRGGSRRDEDRAEIVDVGQGGPGDESHRGWRTGRRRRCRRAGREGRARPPGASERVGGEEGAGVAFAAVEAVGVGGQGEDAGQPSRPSARPADTRCCGRRDRRRARSRWSRRPTAARSPPPRPLQPTVQGVLGVAQAHVARLALDRSPSTTGRSRATRPPRRPPPERRSR